MTVHLDIVIAQNEAEALCLAVAARVNPERALRLLGKLNRLDRNNRVAEEQPR